jgi:hypothetical protein
MKSENKSRPAARVPGRVTAFNYCAVAVGNHAHPTVDAGVSL